MAAPTEHRGSSTGPEVAILLVTHDGAAWLPGVLDGILEQTVAVSTVVAVDTGSRDESLQLVTAALGGDDRTSPSRLETVRAPVGTSFPEAVDRGLAELGSLPVPPEWVWILHDDSRPAPDALAALLQAAEAHPHADFLGPKLREWPSLRRLLEIGVTISGTGRRETGLERGEYDQGQHDGLREVLAVNTAGMLARREALDVLDGFDPHLPIFGNDIDLGWRAAASGRTTVVVPAAVVFHAEAAHRGVRRTGLTGRHTHFQERRAALYTLLVNVRPHALPFQLLRIVVGSLVRVLGFLVVRSVGEALDELAALAAIAGRPGPIHAARRARKRQYAVTRGEAGPDVGRVRRLLAPWWLPYRHGLDAASDLVAALTLQASDVAERRRAAAAERDPSPAPARHSAEEDEFADTGMVVRFLTDPVAVVGVLVALLLVIGARDGFGDISGGALSPAPTARGDWWGLHLAGWHAIGFGTAVPAPGYVLPLAMLGSIVGPGGAMSLLLVLAAPAATWGAWRFLRVVSRLLSPHGAPRWVLLWGAVTYGLVPLAAGAWGSGRWGVLVAAMLLPWTAHAALGFADPEPARRWRAAWRAGLALTLLVAVAPVVWWLFAAVAAVVVGVTAVLVRAVVKDRSVWGPPAAMLAVPVLLLAPWWLPALTHGAGGGLFLDVGRWPTPSTDGLAILAGRFGDSGAPLWAGLVLPVLAALALVPAASRIGVLVCWLVAAVTTVVAVPLAVSTVDLPGAATQQLGLGPVLLLLHGAWTTAVVLGVVGLRGSDVARLGQGALALAALAAVVVPVAGLGWFLLDGSDQLTARAPSPIPVYMQQEAEAADQNGVLVLRGSIDAGVTYEVVRGAGASVGEDEIAALTPEDTAVTGEIRDLVTTPSPSAVTALGDRGVAYLVLPAPADGDIVARLDATAGLERASSDNRSTRAWQVVDAPPASSVDGPRSWLRIVLLVLQLGALPVLVVAALPPLRRRRA